MTQQAGIPTARLERVLSAALDLPIVMAAVNKRAQPVSPGALPEASRAGRRPDSAGRKALALVMRRLGRGNALAARRLQVPHSQYSITHTAGTALAIGADTTQLRGIGVDLEDGAGIPTAGSALILTLHERRQLDQHDGLTADALLRLWTVKEALFKADPYNHRRGWISAYEVRSPRRWIGSARLRTEIGAHRYHYATVALDRGFLSVAVCYTR